MRIEDVVAWSVERRVLVVVGVLLLSLLGLRAFQKLTFDAFPDLTNVQVQVLTSSPGWATEDVELLVTVPIERALTGIPGLVSLRSLSRTGVSAVTAVFEDGTDVQRARQAVQARLQGALDEIPPDAGRPEMAPPITGLGEVVQFTLQSDRHTLTEISRMLQRDIAPRLRSVPGVVEVTTWGEALPRTDIAIRPFALSPRGLRLDGIVADLERAMGQRSGGAWLDGMEQTLVRARSNPIAPGELGGVGLEGSGGVSIPLWEVADVLPGRVPTVGIGTADAEGEALYVVVQLLAGSDALQVVRDVRAALDTIRPTLPDGVEVELLYERDKLVGNTLRTVARSLAEGGGLVILILLIMLGDLRAGLLVASVIPLSMLGAFAGMYVLGFSGNLMSLGAIDFGLIVDGAIVVAESVVAVHGATGDRLRQVVVSRTQQVARPVLFAVGILVLVYVPILLLGGTEGKLFRPMAVTVLLALLTALVLTFTWVPAVGSWVLRPHGEHATWPVRVLSALHQPVLRASLAYPMLAAGAALALMISGGIVASRMGVEFVPRLEEGDLVVQTARLPSLSPEAALEEATRVESVLRTFPEVERVASRTGAPGLATDPMGLEEADVFVRLRPRNEWTSAHTLTDLMSAMERALRTHAPGSALRFTQPIEMRFNELLQGIRADVGVMVYGDDLATLLDLGRQIADALNAVPGAADVVAPVAEGVPGLRVEVQPERLARYGLQAEDVLMIIQAARRGIEVGRLVDGQFRDPVVARFHLPDGMTLADLPIALPDGGTIPLSEVATLVEEHNAVTIARHAGSRRVVVECNVRGTDPGSFVAAAQARIAAEVTLPPGYWMRWSGKMEQVRAAALQTAVLVPLLLLAIFGALWWGLGRPATALLILCNVPVAVSGGVMVLAASGGVISMSAVVGAIALAGVAVMNGIVLLARTQELHASRTSIAAAWDGARERFRPVITTALVATIGFLPMAFAHGPGAEVQRPLALVVVGGLLPCTVLTLVVLPALYARWFRRYDPPRSEPTVLEPTEPMHPDDESLSVVNSPV